MISLHHLSNMEMNVLKITSDMIDVYIFILQTVIIRQNDNPNTFQITFGQACTEHCLRYTDDVNRNKPSKTKISIPAYHRCYKSKLSMQ